MKHPRPRPIPPHDAALAGLTLRVGRARAVAAVLACPPEGADLVALGGALEDLLALCEDDLDTLDRIHMRRCA